ncbi:MAG: hypothetical protein JXR46_09545 [Calditrichaceae bacterium]|nr:hypothetical protein [Calditrichaceae bacterium]
MKNRIALLIMLFGLFSMVQAADPQREWRRVYDLRGQWRFFIGDNPAWAKPDFDDSEWFKIFAPSNWENEGYPGYDGYAWYRKTFEVKSAEHLYVHLGTIDDVDQVYINGKRIGYTGLFPPDYATGYNVDRIYKIPAFCLRTDRKNFIAIRVYDAEFEGGLVRGNLGIYEKLNEPELIKSLEGLWKFATGDNPNCAKYNYDDSRWNELFVPLSWEAQDYNYNGYAWYRLHFKLSSDYKNERLVLLLGKIDDLDETYLNGKMIGKTGIIKNNPLDIRIEGDEWQKVRAYDIDEKDIYFDRDNVLAVRVYDGLVQGGIYEGPIGIITKNEYLKWREKYQDRPFDFFKIFQFLK